jgi:hypothetical protein
VRFKVSAAAIAATMPSQVARADSGNRAGGVKSTTGAEPSRDQSLGIKQGCLPVVTVKRMPVSGSKTWQVGEPNMTPSSVFRSSIIISVLVGGLSLSAKAETVGVMGNVATTDGSFTIAQTNGWIGVRTVGIPGRTAVSRKERLAQTNATANSPDAKAGVVESLMTTDRLQLLHDASGCQAVWTGRTSIG